MLIALEGYTPAAVNRAHNDDLDIILDVLNLDELKEFQGHAAIPYSGEYGLSIAAPFGWIVDVTRRPNMLASLYQRGLTFEEAVRSEEWMYINFWKKPGNEISDLEALLRYQAAYMLKDPADGEIKIVERSRNQRVGVRTLIYVGSRSTPVLLLSTPDLLIFPISSSFVSFSRRSSSNARTSGNCVSF